MTKHYSTKDFFRNTPNPRLARYFTARGVLLDFDFTAIKDTMAIFDEAELHLSENGAHESFVG